MSSIREQLLGFVAELRAAGVRISVGETLDAMRAVAAAGLGRTRMREALAAALVKDEADRFAFDEVFVRFFGGSGARAGERHKRPGRQPSAAHGSGRGLEPGERGGKRASEHEPRGTNAAKPMAAGAPSKTQAPDGEQDKEPSTPEGSDESKAHPDAATRLGEDGKGPRQDESWWPDSQADEAGPGIEAGRRARMRAAERTPFALYSDLDYELARETLAPLARRFRVRLSRRLRHARAGRIDFRRTIRAAIQRGGALCDLRFRARRPRHIDLLILADVSGSVRYAATLMMELVAGASECFRRVRSFVFVDRLAEADFEDGYLLMTPALDLYARSDFGRVLGELWERRAELLGRATLLVIMGDGRNNRRPARVDLLRDIARLCRAAVWLIPEPRERWGTGDSAIHQYAREVDALLPSGNLLELERALEKIA
jgi:uncharacterized protein with von Willebrand factor type A (vWA) domain